MIPRAKPKMSNVGGGAEMIHRIIIQESNSLWPSFPRPRPVYLWQTTPRCPFYYSTWGCAWAQKWISLLWLRLCRIFLAAEETRTRHTFPNFLKFLSGRDWPDRDDDHGGSQDKRYLITCSRGGILTWLGLPTTTGIASGQVLDRQSNWTEESVNCKASLAQFPSRLMTFRSKCSWGPRNLLILMSIHVLPALGSVLSSKVTVFSCCPRNINWGIDRERGKLIIFFKELQPKKRPKQANSLKVLLIFMSCSGGGRILLFLSAKALLCWGWFPVFIAINFLLLTHLFVSWSIDQFWCSPAVKQIIDFIAFWY